jgi:hypothetical protein
MDEIQENEEQIDIGEGGEEAEGLPGLEKKYQKQMRQIVTQKLDLPVSALPAMLKEQIKLNPEFQRRERWDVSRQSRLIESLLMNVPIPPVFLGEDEYGQYVVLDGRQRLTAISKFLNNDLVLEDLDVWDELNGMTYQDLVKRQQDKYLTRRFVPAVVILKESSPVVKYDVFDRLNTGGIRANEMEIRNAIYRGSFTDAIHKLSRLPEFCILWNISTDIFVAEKTKLYQQMDDLQLVLRFFALYEYEAMNVRFRDYLSEFMEQRNRVYKEDPSKEKQDTERFIRASRNCWRVFGSDTFYKPPGKNGRRQRSFPLADALMVTFADYPVETFTGDKAEKVRAAINALFENSDFVKSIGTGTNGKGAISTRIKLAKQAVHDALS